MGNRTIYYLTVPPWWTYALLSQNHALLLQKPAIWFSENGGGRWKAVWNFFENSSVFVGWPFPKVHNTLNKICHRHMIECLNIIPGDSTWCINDTTCCVNFHLEISHHCHHHTFVFILGAFWFLLAHPGQGQQTQPEWAWPTFDDPENHKIISYQLQDGNAIIIYMHQWCIASWI